MTPIHPIGLTNRKGRNNALAAGPDDPGSPYAVGAAEGGHDAVHPGLGTVEDVRALCATAAEHGMDVAMDFAINASADHPWLTDHPDWFHRRPDGTLKYAENPPKRYQDIYNVNWESDDWRGLWEEWRGIFLFWVDCGVKVYRVDNPHTKPIPFWEWLIAEVHKVDRDVIFLAEAFTRRAVMRQLAKIGFTQGYTYFTWKNTRHELTEYVNELAGGRSGSTSVRTSSPTRPTSSTSTWCTAGRPRSTRASCSPPRWARPTASTPATSTTRTRRCARGPRSTWTPRSTRSSSASWTARCCRSSRRVNAIRRENPALQYLSNVAWLETQNDQLMAYVKQHGGNTMIVAVNLDPHHAQEGSAMVPAQLGLPPAFAVTDQLSGERFDWRIGPNYVRLDPWTRQAHILRVDG